MKIIFVFFGLILVIPLYSQKFQLINFEDSIDSNFTILEIDTFYNAQNIWQIGRPGKQMFSSAYSPERVIVTDSINPYPVNDTSAFLVRLILDRGVFSERITIKGYYQVDSDTLNDYGTFEISLDNGATWRNLLDNDFYCAEWYWIKPTFTGNSDNFPIPNFNGWQHFHFEYTFWPDCWPGYVPVAGDTIIFRFGFISDGIQTNNAGLMFDDISFYDSWGGIEIFSSHFHSNAFPNPTNGPICIEFDNTKLNNHSLFVFDSHGKRVLEMALADKNCIELDLGDYPPGLYFYKLINQEDQSISHGRLIKM